MSRLGVLYPGLAQHHQSLAPTHITSTCPLAWSARHLGCSFRVPELCSSASCSPQADLGNVRHFSSVPRSPATDRGTGLGPYSRLSGGRRRWIRSVTYYERLGLKPPSDPREIKMAYFKRAKECHPDLHGDAKREEFQKLSEAYAVLSDPEKKRMYDASGYRESSSSRQQTYQQRNADEEMDEALRQFWNVWMEFGVQDYFDTIQRELQEAYNASTRTGSIGPLYDFALRNKGVVLAVLVPTIVLFRFPFLAVAVGRFGLSIFAAVLQLAMRNPELGALIARALWRLLAAAQRSRIPGRRR